MQIRRPLKLWVAFNLLLGGTCPALALDARSPAAGYLRTTFTTEDGLGANVINDILQSRAGFLWIASHMGVTRFDGQHFNHVPFHQLIVNVNSITEGQDGDLWLGTMAGIIRVSPRILDVPHNATPPKTWYGESIGHYEGDTLVIDTIGLNDKTDTDRFGTPHSDQMHVVDRYRLSADRATLEVRFTVEDPEFFTTAWSGRADYRRDARSISELICAENNQSDIGDQRPIPTAAKPDF